MHQFLNYVWAWCVRRFDNAEDGKLEEWVAMMESPLPTPKGKQGPRRPTEAEMESEGEGFMALMAQVKGA